MLIDDVGNYALEICTFLRDTREFILQNDLTEDEISNLKLAVQTLSSAPIVQCQNGDFSINECDFNPHCLAIALEAESLEILLDAKAYGQVGLEKNIPPPVEPLGEGSFNSVQRAYTKPAIGGGEASGPIALKPCDQSKKESSLSAFESGVVIMQSYVGLASGTYRRNKATSMVQYMLCDIGRTKGITVPHVIAAISAAEMDGVPSIAMEMLKGPTVAEAAAEKKITKSNEFKRRETWIQVQDIATGQVDRHGGNVMLTEAGPVAIDHDFSYPTNPPRRIAEEIPMNLVATFQTPGSQFKEGAVDGVLDRNYGMPPVIDREMYDVIMAIDLHKWEGMHKECGLIELEVRAAMARTRGLQAAAQQLNDLGRVIRPDEWASSPLVGQLCNQQNFYAERHFAGK
jgi:hypothetical protein